LIEFAEEQALLLRQRAGVDPLDRLDPGSLAHALELIILKPTDILGADPADCALVAAVDAKVWSGMGRRLPDGHLLVLGMQKYLYIPSASGDVGDVNEPLVQVG